MHRCTLSRTDKAYSRSCGSEGNPSCVSMDFPPYLYIFQWWVSIIFHEADGSWIASMMSDEYGELTAKAQGSGSWGAFPHQAKTHPCALAILSPSAANASIPPHPRSVSPCPKASTWTISHNHKERCRSCWVPLTKQFVDWRRMAANIFAMWATSCTRWFAGRLNTT